MSVAADGQGGFVHAGVYGNSLDLGGGPLPAPPSDDQYFGYIAQFDGNGAHQWSHALSGWSLVDNQGLVLDLTTIAGGPVVLASTQAPFSIPNAAHPPHASVTRFDAQGGGGVWSHDFPLTGSPRLRLARDLAGRVMLAGSFDATLTVGADVYVASGSSDAVLIELDASDGSVAWSKHIVSAGSVDLTSVGGAANGDTLVAGSFDGTLDLGGGPSSGTGPAFTARFGPTGQHLQSDATTTFISFSSVFEGAAGGTVLCGLSEGGTLRILAVDAMGTPLANETISGAPPPPDTNGSPWLSGYCRPHPSGDVLVHGAFDHGLDLGVGPVLPNAGDWDIFLGRFAP